MNNEFKRMIKLAGLTEIKVNKPKYDVDRFLNANKDETFENILKPMFKKVLQDEGEDIENISLFDKYKTLNWNQGTQEEYEYAELSIDDKLKLKNDEDLFIKLGFQASFSPYPEEIVEEYNIEETMVGRKKIYSFSFNF